MITGQSHVRLTGDFATAVIDICHIQLHPLSAADQTAQAVIQGIADQVNSPLADQFTVLVVEILYLNLEVLLAGNLAAAVVEAGGGDKGTPVSHHHTTLVLHFTVNAQAHFTQAIEHASAVIQAADTGIDAVG